MGKINKTLLPVKLHYLFFMAAWGPSLPFLPLFGKALGVSEFVNGIINASLPLAYLLFKPVVGFLLDFFQSQRKLIFLVILFLAITSYFGIAFIPQTYKEVVVGCGELTRCNHTVIGAALCKVLTKNVSQDVMVDLGHKCSMEPLTECIAVKCIVRDSGLYFGLSFWLYVVLSCLGSVGYNLTNCISDVICFDVLGEGKQHKYGAQRVYGTIGFGLSALAGSCIIIYFYSGQHTLQSHIPAFILGAIFMVVDIICCFKLKFPPLPRSENIIKDVTDLVKKPKMAVFMAFATCAGVCDSAIMFFLLWYLEDLARISHTENFILISGLVIALETLCGEVVVFALSGRIIKKLGYINCFTLCFALYSLRLGLVGWIPSPWWALPIEVFLQGPTYGLFYATIVEYASAVSPAGTSATVQGIVAGMDDGLGFCIGNITGGLIYSIYGGKIMFLSAAVFALTCSIVHFLVHLALKNDGAELMTEQTVTSVEKGREAVVYAMKEMTQEVTNG